MKVEPSCPFKDCFPQLPEVVHDTLSMSLGAVVLLWVWLASPLGEGLGLCEASLALAEELGLAEELALAETEALAEEREDEGRRACVLARVVGTCARESTRYFMIVSLLRVVASVRSASLLGRATSSRVRSKKVWRKAARVWRSAVISASERGVAEEEGDGEALVAEVEGDGEALASEEEAEGVGEEDEALEVARSSGTVSSSTRVCESVAKVTPDMDAADRIE